MKSGIRWIAVLLILPLMFAAQGCSNSSSPSEPEAVLIGSFPLSSIATYLHLCTNPGDPFDDSAAADTTPIELADYGLAPGNSITIEIVGDFDNGNGQRERAVAVFSSSDELLAKSEAHRVPGAIAAGTAFVTTPNEGCGHEPTDIPEDFDCTPEVSITIPQGASHIFICARDSYYSDNSDAENDFGVKIWKHGD
jgi:hypothetical protein